MLPQLALSPAQKVKALSVRRSAPRFRKVAFAIAFATVFCAFLGLGWSSITPKIHAQVEKHRILRALQSVPSLRLRFKVKRESMRVHGQDEFEAFATPYVASNSDAGETITFNGIATFTEGLTTHKYSLIDNIAYYSTQTNEAGALQESVTCLSPDLVPPVNEVLSAINGATHVSGVDGIGLVDCPAGQLLKFRFADDDFALCASPTASTERGFDIFGSDLEIQVRYVAEPVVIVTPALSADVAATCEKLPGASTVSTKTMGLLTGTGSDVLNHIAGYSEESMTLQGSSCGCKGPRRPCIFFHGVDQEVENSVLLDTYKDQWGDIQKNAPCCSTIKFAQIDTKNVGWEDDKLQQKVCDFSLSMSNSSNQASKTIEDTIIVAHSMGNLMLAGAIATGKCSLAKSADWVAISGPLRGSIGSDFVQTICNGGNFGEEIVKAVVALFGQCPVRSGRQSLSYEGDPFCPPTLQAQYDAAQLAYKSAATAALCSTSFWGLLSLDQLTLALGGSIIPHKSKENDGVVEYQSCVADLPATQFQDRYDSRFYKAQVNHLDAAFRHGDGLFSNARKPVKWFECLL